MVPAMVSQWYPATVTKTISRFYSAGREVYVQRWAEDRFCVFLGNHHYHHEVLSLQQAKEHVKLTSANPADNTENIEHQFQWMINS